MYNFNVQHQSKMFLVSANYRFYLQGKTIKAKLCICWTLTILANTCRTW